MDRVEATKVTMTWEELSHHDLRGILHTYEIVVKIESCETTVANTFTSEYPSTTVNLESDLEYCIEVAAKTGAAVGRFTSPCTMYIHTILNSDYFHFVYLCRV